MINNRADLDKASTDNGATSLLMESQTGYLDCARLPVFENRTKIDDVRIDDSETPLMMASLHDRVDCARLRESRHCQLCEDLRWLDSVRDGLSKGPRRLRDASDR